MSKRLVNGLGNAIYEEACHYKADQGTVDRIIAGVSDFLDDKGIEAWPFQQAAGWDDEEHTRWLRGRK